MSDIVINIENVNSRLLTRDLQLKKILADKLKFRPKDYFHNSAYKKGRWDGYNYFFHEKTGFFLTGILPEIRYVLSKLGKEYEIVDNTQPVNFLYENIGRDFLDPWAPESLGDIKLHDYQPDLVNQCIKYKRGLVQAPTGCHRQGQEILMYNGEIKLVEDVVVGDELMGMDSTPRKVIELCRGIDRMYEIKPSSGKSFFVNENHILTLVKSTGKKDKYVDVSVKDWMNWSEENKNKYMLFKVGVEFYNKYKLKTPPYIYGAFITSGEIQGSKVSIETDRVLVQDRLKELAQDAHVDCKIEESIVSMTEREGQYNPIALELKKLGMVDTPKEERCISHHIITSSKDARLQILAGIVDVNAVLNEGQLKIKLKSKKLSDCVEWLVRSLGFESIRFESGDNNIIFVLGNLSKIPSSNFNLKDHKKFKGVVKSTFTIELASENEKYYGFRVDEDNRYLLGDFTVTHNSGKTFILVSLLKCLPPKTPTLFITKNSQLVHQNWEEMKMWGVQDLGRWYDKYKEKNYVMCVTNHFKTFESLDKLLPKFKCLIVDEVHDCMSDVPISAYKKMTGASVRIGISATAFKWDKKKINDVHKWNMKGFFGPVFKTTTTDNGMLTTKELQNRGILAKSDCIFYPVTNPDLRHETYQEAVKLGIEQNFHFHEMVKKLADSCEGRTLIVVERIEQGQYLQQLIKDSHFIRGSDKLKDREPILNSLKEGERAVVIVMRQIITAGINVKVHNLINAAGGEGAHNVIQLMGRGLRTAKDKEGLKYYDFHFRINDYLRKHSEWRYEVIEKEGHNVKMEDSFDL